VSPVHKGRAHESPAHEGSAHEGQDREGDGRALLSRRLDRRAFLGGAGFAAGAVMATVLVPLSIVHSVPAADASIGLTPLPGDPSWNGHVDDACGHWPPYAHDIPYNVMGTRESSVTEVFAANVDPADHFLLMV
jgi:hypothetical protein